MCQPRPTQYPASSSLQRPHFVPFAMLLLELYVAREVIIHEVRELKRGSAWRPPVARRQPRDGTQHHAVRAVHADLSVAAELIRAHPEVGTLATCLAPALDASSSTKLAAGLPGRQRAIHPEKLEGTKPRVPRALIVTSRQVAAPRRSSTQRATT
jgi:hypothetical protein